MLTRLPATYASIIFLAMMVALAISGLPLIYFGIRGFVHPENKTPCQGKGRSCRDRVLELVLLRFQALAHEFLTLVPFFTVGFLVAGRHLVLLSAGWLV